MKKYEERLNALLAEVSMLCEEHKLTKADCPEKVSEYLVGKRINEKGREIMTVLMMNARNEIIHTMESEGTVNYAVVYPREVVKEALLHNAVSIIMSHNHPSGDLSPSAQDIRLTESINKACQTLEITLLDHIITGYRNAEFFSFGNEGIL